MTSPSRALQSHPEPRDLGIDTRDLRTQRTVPVFTPASDLRAQLGTLALEGIVALTYRGDDLICGIPERRGSLVLDWVRIFGCGHVSRFCFYRSDCETQSCPVCVEAGISRLNEGDVQRRLQHVGSVAQGHSGAARGSLHQGEDR